MELDESAAVITYEEYHPYGTSTYLAGRSAAEVSLKRYRYTGKERDEETGMSYHHARYYVSWLGRWSNTDPAGFADSVNVYSYTRNNPVIFNDPSGTQSNDHVEHRAPPNVPLLPAPIISRPAASALLLRDVPPYRLSPSAFLRGSPTRYSSMYGRSAAQLGLFPPLRGALGDGRLTIPGLETPLRPTPTEPPLVKRALNVLHRAMDIPFLGPVVVSPVVVALSIVAVAVFAVAGLGEGLRRLNTPFSLSGFLLETAKINLLGIGAPLQQTTGERDQINSGASGEQLHANRQRGSRVREFLRLNPPAGPLRSIIDAVLPSRPAPSTPGLNLADAAIRRGGSQIPELVQPSPFFPREHVVRPLIRPIPQRTLFQ
ncbi:MAG: RHS repeat-associated core domain-containing protein [bacterium]